MDHTTRRSSGRRAISHLLALVVALGCLLGACGGPAGSTAEGEVPEDLSILVPVVPPAFDQWSTVMQPLGTILMVNEPLIRYDGSELVPGLAESFEEIDQTHYRYTLRPGVTFSDGTPLTAQDVRFSLETSMLDTHASTTWVTMTAIAGIEVEDDRTVLVTLERPEPQFQYVLAQTGIVSEAFYTEHGDRVGTPGVGQLGSGPYVLESFTPDQEAVITRNPDYWGDPAAFASITFTATPDDSARMLALQSGGPTGIFEIPIGQVGAVESIGSYDVFEVPDTTFYIVQTDVTVPPFDDPAVRAAVRHAINRDTVVDAAFGGRGVPASTLTSAERLSALADPEQVAGTLAGFDTANTYDPDRARSLMAGSTVPDGFAVELPVETTDPNMPLIGQSIVQDLAAIGIDVTIRPMGEEYLPTVLIGREHEGLTLNSFGTNTPDPAMPMAYFVPADAIFNATGSANEAAAALLEESQGLPVDDPRRGELLLQSLEALQDGGSVLPLAMPNMYFGLSAGLVPDGFTNYWWMDRWDLRVVARP